MSDLSAAAKAYPIRSEIHGTYAAAVIGALGMRVEAVKDDPGQCLSACISLWWAVRGLDHIAIAVRTACGYDDPAGVHFSIAMNNERRRIGEYIEERCGCDPEEDPAFQSLRRG